MRGALFGDELYLPNFSPTWVPASTPNHKTYLCTRKVAAWLRENFIRLIAEGGGTVSRSSQPRSWVRQASASVDTVVVTWALCSVPDATAALAEAHRVLRPGGSLRFVEHGRSPDASVAWWQDHLTPLWKRCSGGCHLNRQTDDLLRSVGFRLARLKTGYAQGPRPMTFMYEGQAEPQR